LIADTASASSKEILSAATAFWTDLNLGDFEKMPALGRNQDIAYIPTPKSNEAAGMMKMKDLPELSDLRAQISNKITKVFNFSSPKISENGMTAEVQITPVKSEVRAFRELKMIYDVYMAEAYEAQTTKGSYPTLDSVKEEVLAPNSAAQKRIDEQASEIANQKYPPILFEKTSQGWRINLQALFGEK